MKETIQVTSLAPNEALSPFIESYWMIRNPSDQDEELVTFPDGGIDVYFFSNNEFPLHVSLVGLETQKQQGIMPKQSVLMGVRLNLLAVEYLLKRSVADILNDRTSLTPGYAGIEQEDLEDFNDFCDKLGHYFSSQLDHAIDSRKRIMSDLIYQTNGSITVNEIAQSANWSSRQINRYFNKWLGLPLKNYCDILRFRHSFDSLKAGELFPDRGFNDQSHYIRFTRKYASLTPKQLAHDKSDRFIQLSS